MNDKSNPSGSTGKCPISRRRFLEKSVSGAALAGTAMLPAWAPLSPPFADNDLLQEAADKASKASAQYRDSPNGDERCGVCAHFRGGRCAIVEGRISSNGWCRHFKRKSGAGSGGRSSGGSGRSGGGSGGSSGGGRSGY